MRVRLTRKLAEALNGLDLRPFAIGEVIDLTDPLAQMLIAERWAEEAVPVDCPSIADDRTPGVRMRGKPRRRDRSRRTKT